MASLSTSNDRSLIVLGRTSVRCAFALFLSIATLATHAPATAAVRRCGDFIATAGEDRVSENAAKQKAMALWIDAAGKQGPAFTAWRLAIDKSLSCLTLPTGMHLCQVLARPCGISQVPEALPPGTTPVAPAAPKREQRS